MIYRVVRDGDVFLVQRRRKYWPFWSYGKAFSDSGDSYTMEFDSTEAAEKTLDRWILEDRPDAPLREVVRRVV